MRKPTCKVSWNTGAFFLLTIPFSLANFSHLVSCLGLGTGNDLGRTVEGVGNLATIVSSIRSVGNCQISLNKIWVLSLVKFNK